MEKAVFNNQAGRREVGGMSLHRIIHGVCFNKFGGRHPQIVDVTVLGKLTQDSTTMATMTTTTTTRTTTTTTMTTTAMTTTTATKGNYINIKMHNICLFFATPVVPLTGATTH